MKNINYTFYILVLFFISCNGDADIFEVSGEEIGMTHSEIINEYGEDYEFSRVNQANMLEIGYVNATSTKIFSFSGENSDAVCLKIAVGFFPPKVMDSYVENIIEELDDEYVKTGLNSWEDNNKNLKYEFSKNLDALLFLVSPNDKRIEEIWRKVLKGDIDY